MDYLKAFLVGGLLCAAAQLLIDKTKLMPARILVIFVCGGCVLGALGLYEPFVKFGGTGATLPLPGFGYSLYKGAMEEIASTGILGVISGGLKKTATGIMAALLCGLIAATVSSSKEK